MKIKVRVFRLIKNLVYSIEWMKELFIDNLPLSIPVRSIEKREKKKFSTEFSCNYFELLKKVLIPCGRFMKHCNSPLIPIEG